MKIKISAPFIFLVFVICMSCSKEYKISVVNKSEKSVWLFYELTKTEYKDSNIKDFYRKNQHRDLAPNSSIEFVETNTDLRFYYLGILYSLTNSNITVLPSYLTPATYIVDSFYDSNSLVAGTVVSKSIQLGQLFYGPVLDDSWRFYRYSNSLMVTYGLMEY